MNNSLRSYACVRNRLRLLKRTRSDLERSINEVEPPPAYLRSLRAAIPVADLSGPADLLIRNARIFPAVSSCPDPVSIAVKNGRIARIGSDSTGVSDLGTRVVDAGGRSVIAGLCDCHVHLMVGAEHNQGCSVEDVRDSDTLRRRLQAFVHQHPESRVYYVYGLHYLNPPLIPTGTARRLLDEIVADKPLFIYAHDLHTAWVNTRALETADLLHGMPPFPGLLSELAMCGNLELDRDGLPSGELREPPVYFLVEEALRRRFPLSVEEKKSHLEQACLDLASRGLTSVHAMGLGLPEEDIECLLLLLELEHEGRLPLRVHLSCSVVPDELMLEDVLHAAEVRDHLERAHQGRSTLPELHRQLLELMKKTLRMRQDEKHVPASGPHALWNHFVRNFSHIITSAHVAEHGERGQRLRSSAAGSRLAPAGKVQCQAVKLFMDGVVEKDTAFRLDHHPLPGIPSFSGRELDLVVRLADRLGLQVAAHCIGDGSVNAMLNSIESTRRQNAEIDRQRGELVRHRIEHIEMCTAFDIPRFSDLGVIASMQALHERAPMTLWHEKVPEIQWPTAFAWKSLLDAGTTLVFGSDWPIVSCNCFEGIQRATSRKPWRPGLPDQHLALDQALTAFSASAAEAEYGEQCRGSLREGMQADLVILSEDLDRYQGDFAAVVVTHTICDGAVVYSAS